MKRRSVIVPAFAVCALMVGCCAVAVAIFGGGPRLGFELRWFVDFFRALVQRGGHKFGRE